MKGEMTDQLTSPSAVDYSDIQGLVRFGYGPLPEASYLLLNIVDAAAARAWLATAPVTTAVKLSQVPKTALQVAFTREGLQALGVADDVVAGFSPEFLSGMTGQPSRSRRLGDVAASDPLRWRWGGPGAGPHLLLMLYAQPGHLDEWTQFVQGSHWKAAFEVLDCLPTSNLFGAEPFGFKDGISQPTPDWQRERVPETDQLEYGNLLTLGEFLLGYPNEYGRYTQRPLLPDLPATSGLPFAEDDPQKRDLGRNGTYLVFRQLQQDVRGFWRFLDSQTNSDSQSRQTLAESMIGRKMDGTALLPTSAEPIPGTDPRYLSQNEFTYLSDRDGIRCPLGAHIRRANPRNADLPPGSTSLLDRVLHKLGFGNRNFRDDVIASTRFHRILRRGREYGPPLPPEEAIGDAPDKGEHGIHFICIVANILRQFEFVQNAWIVGTKFDALTEESDPLLGNREAVPGCPFTNTFSIPQASGVRTRITNLPQFVTVRGGAYFFLPSLSALRYFANAGNDPPGA
jgi:deferrochelatase/peroxidase EfeB